MREISILPIFFVSTSEIIHAGKGFVLGKDIIYNSVGVGSAGTTPLYEIERPLRLEEYLYFFSFFLFTNNTTTH